MERMEELFAGRWLMGWNAKLAPRERSVLQGKDSKEPSSAEVERV
jgi:hypothetical protein